MELTKYHGIISEAGLREDYKDGHLFSVNCPHHHPSIASVDWLNLTIFPVLLLPSTNLFNISELILTFPFISIFQST